MAQPILEAREMHSEGYAGVRRTWNIEPCGAQPRVFSRGDGSCPDILEHLSLSIVLSVCPSVYLKPACLDLVDLLSEERSCSPHSLLLLQALLAWLLGCADSWAFLGLCR